MTIRSRALLGALAALSATVATSTAAQETRIGGFADATYRSGTGQERGPQGFGLGQFDLYITSRVSDRVRFIGETVFEFDQDWRVDVERVILTYSARRWAEVAIGKHHTPIGYWNTAYHHGAVLQPTAVRPDLVRFEDEGGLLPIHTTGLLVSGRDIGRWHAGYDLLLGNGIGSTPTEDDNPSKSVTLAAHVQATSALRVGASAYFDRVAQGTTNAAGRPLGAAMSQQILGAHIAYLPPELEFIAEFHRATNTLAGSSARTTDGGYAYLGRRFDDLVPYLRYDAVIVAANDPWFDGAPLRAATVGTRWDLASTATIKVEVRRQQRSGGPASTQFLAQFAIGF